jgi:hypothetical protein
MRLSVGDWKRAGDVFKPVYDRATKSSTKKMYLFGALIGLVSLSAIHSALIALPTRVLSHFVKKNIKKLWIIFQKLFMPSLIAVLPFE